MRSVSATLGPLLPLFARERRAGRALALGVLVHTSGSTYQKPGALILIAAGGDYAGLISGGCLEGDLREHALAVIADGRARDVHYDLSGPDELLWGLGLGCDGSMRILILRVGPENDWQPLHYLREALWAQQPAAIGLVCASTQAQVPVGSLALPLALSATPPALASPAVQSALAQAATATQGGWLAAPDRAWELFLVPLSLPPRILILGAGPDAVPVVDIATRLNWKVTLFDHRAAYASDAHFPAAEEVVQGHPEELPGKLPLGGFHAAVIMSHHLPSDQTYLRLLAGTSVPYIGLLGPPGRRDRLLDELGAEAPKLHGRLHSPVGLPLGGRTPEAIALAIIAQIHAALYAGSTPAAQLSPATARLALAE